MRALYGYVDDPDFLRRVRAKHVPRQFQRLDATKRPIPVQFHIADERQKTMPAPAPKEEDASSGFTASVKRGGSQGVGASQQVADDRVESGKKY